MARAMLVMLSATTLLAGALSGQAPAALTPPGLTTSGTLAYSSGPVHDTDGRRIATFNSIWRREPDGTWLVVFDKGCPVCNCERGP